MSRMSLLHSFGISELKSPEMEGTDQPETRRVVDSSDSVQSGRSSDFFPGPIAAGKGGISRPPGLGISVPSPIGKLGHSYTSSASSTAQNLTLTPTSSLDGGELYGRQSSPFQGDGPSLSSDYSRRADESELPPGIANLGSFDGEDGEHDGLLGLQALRDRAHSLPGSLGPYSSSPPVRGQIGAFDDSRVLNRPRAVSRDNGRSQSAKSRPPLSGGAGQSPHTSDHKSYQSGYSSSGSRSRDHSPTPPGIISRPGNIYEPPERPYDPSRGRPMTIDTGRDFAHPPFGDRNQPSMDQLVHKFGQMGNVAQGQFQGLRPGQHNYQRQQRSSSLPGPVPGQGLQPEYVDERTHDLTRRGSDYGIGMSSRLHPSEGDYGDARYPTHQFPQYGHEMHAPPPAINQRRSSLQAIPGSNPGFYGQALNIHRRESLDFVPGHNRYPDGIPVVATNEEMRIYATPEERGGFRPDRMVSPSHSPLHVQYSSHHSRHHSDMSMSVGSAGVRSVRSHDVYSGSRSRHRVTHSDDDLSHPLIGEHIEVPADDRAFQFNDMTENAPGRHSRSSSVDQPLPHYGGASAAHIMPPTAGSALQMPKVVYNVKFKRTQRTFVLGPRLNRDLKIGTYVKVEADRGEDLGIVVGKIPSDKFLASKSTFRSDTVVPPPPTGMAPTGGAVDLKRIIRLATHDEVSLLQMKREEEDELLKICRAKVKQRALPMNVVDAEYQFDRHKLTFFFEAEGRVDFRELVRDLFSMYKTRIWMQQLDKSTSATCPPAPLETQQLVMDHGTPIIAPESEYSDFTQGAPGESTE